MILLDRIIIRIFNIFSNLNLELVRNLIRYETERRPFFFFIFIVFK